MKNYLLIASLFLLISCDFSNNSENTESSSDFAMEYPEMDERVVAYINNGDLEYGNYENSRPKITTDIDKLKLIFKVALNENNFDPKCDYFAISMLTGEYLSYFTVSKYQSDKIDPNDDVLAVYNVHPSLKQPSYQSYNENDNYGDYAPCMYPQAPRAHGILICDKKGDLKNRVHFPYINYNDPTWDCWKAGEAVREPFFEFRK